MCFLVVIILIKFGTVLDCCAVHKFIGDWCNELGWAIRKMHGKLDGLRNNFLLFF